MQKMQRPKHLQRLGMKVHMWKYFVLFSLVLVALLWFLQILCFRIYYETMKMQEIEDAGAEIVNAYPNYDSEGYQNFVSQLAFERGITVYAFNSDGTFLTTDLSASRFGYPRLGRAELSEFFRMASTSRKNGVTYRYSEPETGMNVICYAASVPKEDGSRLYLYIKSPLMPLDSTMRVLQSQLILVTVLSFIISLILSYFIANWLARPIVKITKSANILAKGDYTVHFEEGGYREINELADTLNFATSELSKTDQLRRDLIANVSHDLRTPLTIIKSYAEMIRDLSGNNPQKREAHTQVIIDETDRLSALVSDILDLSKMESGTMVLSKTDFDLAALAESILNNFRYLEESEGYTFEFMAEKNLIVLADEQKLGQVIFNLISNAVNHTGDNKHISIRVVKKVDRVRFSIRDFGEGIAPEELKKVWDRYYRSSRNNGREVKGSGIGLSIVKNILELHGSRYGVQSAVGEGSTFWFEI